jgi:hypothetical protein
MYPAIVGKLEVATVAPLATVGFAPAPKVTVPGRPH